MIVPGPGVTVGAELHFARGAFNGGNFRVAEFPGILVFSDVWLNEIRIGFQLHPVVFSGGVTFGFQPIAPPDTYAIGVRGDFQIEVGPPVVVQISRRQARSSGSTSRTRSSATRATVRCGSSAMSRSAIPRASDSPGL